MPLPTTSTQRWRLPRFDADYAVMSSLYALFYGSWVSWLSFFNVYMRQMGLSGMEIGLIGGVRPAVMLLSQPLWGLLADTRGRRRILMLTMTTGALFLLGYTRGSGFQFIFVWTIVMTLVSNPVSPMLDSLALDHVAQRPGRSFGPVRLWGAAGWAGFSLLTGMIVTGRSLQLTFVVGAALLFVAAALLWLTGRPAETTRRALTSWQGATALLRDRRLLAILLLAAAMQAGITCYYAFFSVYLTELQASRQLISMGYTIQGLSELPLFLASAWIIRRIGARGAIVLCILVFAGRFVLYSIISRPVFAVTLGLTHGFSFSLYLVAIVSYINKLVPAQWRATGQSLFSAASAGAGAIVGNAWAGFLYDRVGTHGLFATNAGILVVISLAAAVIVREQAPPPAPQTP